MEKQKQNPISSIPEPQTEAAVNPCPLLACVNGIIVPWNHSPSTIDLHGVRVILSLACIEMTPLPHYTSWTMDPGDYYSYHTDYQSAIL